MNSLFCSKKHLPDLFRFFPLLGALFGFVVSDVKAKISILEHYLTKGDESSQYYDTVQSMIQYEVSNNITVVKGKPPSASRTLLRLHRALEFIIQFLVSVTNVSDSDPLGPVANKVYHDTLGQHHIWVIRKAVSFGVSRLPTRIQLLEQMDENGEAVDKTLQLLNQAVLDAQPIYDTVQELYADNDLLHLP